MITAPMQRISYFLKISLAVSAVALMAFAGGVYAQSIPPLIGIANSSDPSAAAGTLKGFACGFAGWIFIAAIILSIILALLTGIQYMTGGGNPEKIKSAHQKLMWIAIGIAVALMARVMPTIVNGILHGSGGGGLDVCQGDF
jgi:hypothetical protein